MTKNIKQILHATTTKLKKCNSQTPQLDAEVLLAHTLKKSRAYIMAHSEEKLTKLQIKNYKLKITRRSLDEPIAYITGYKEFYGLDFIVSKHTLIPRPETELLVDEALTIIKPKIENPCLVGRRGKSKITLIDVGTGSGCVIISIAEKLKVKSDCARLTGKKLKVSFIASDISKCAIDVAKKNAKIHGVNKKITFLQGNLFDPILKSKIVNRKSSILVIANLPYLSKTIYEMLPSSVKNHEPKVALLAGEDGLDYYRKLFNQIKLLFTDHCLLVTVLCEISLEQKNLFKKEVKAVFSSSKISFSKDLSGKWRLAKCVLE